MKDKCDRIGTVYAEKIPTRVPGLDELLYGGLNLSEKSNIIVIKGDESIDKTLLGIQLGYGIAQSLSIMNDDNRIYEVNIISNYHKKEYLDDLLLDTLIAHCTQKMIELKSSINADFSGNHLFNTFFSKRLYSGLKENLKQTPPPSCLEINIDNLICEEAIFYNNRTNGLHYRCKPFNTSSTTMLFERRQQSVEDYFSENNSYFPIGVKVLREKIQTPIVNAHIYEMEIKDFFQQNLMNENDDIYVYDLIDYKKIHNWQDIITGLNKHRVSILVVPKDLNIPNDLASIIIELGNKEYDNYYIYNMSIRRSISQQTCLGVHQYKKRDYGLEVFPNIYTYFSKRRFMQRAIVYTHSDIVTPTFQQYLDSIPDVSSLNDYSYNCYKKNIDSLRLQNIKELTNPKDTYYSSVDVLERIFMSRKYNCRNKNKEVISNYRGGVTAVIGNPNTYKRHITFGSIFSSSLNEEHTLLFLLNKDDATIRRRMMCPALSVKNKCEESVCSNCYSNIHFMNIFMGNITPAELLFYIKKQIEIPYKTKHIKRIVIDDIQIIDYCFPLLRESDLFISSLITLCREKEIDLFLLCDKTAKSAKQLLAVADNVICTQRDTDGSLLLFVEHYAGFDKEPSKVYCGKVKKPQLLFECYDTVDSENMPIKQYGINESEVEDVDISDMDDFWVYKDIKNHKKK